MPGLLRSTPSYNTSGSDTDPETDRESDNWVGDLREAIDNHDTLVDRFNSLRRELDAVSADLARARHTMLVRARGPEYHAAGPQIVNIYDDTSDSDEETEELLRQARGNRRYYSESLESSGEILLPSQDNPFRLPQDMDDEEEVGLPERPDNPVFRSSWRSHRPEGPRSSYGDRHIRSPGYRPSGLSRQESLERPPPLYPPRDYRSHDAQDLSDNQHSDPQSPLPDLPLRYPLGPGFARERSVSPDNNR